MTGSETRNLYSKWFGDYRPCQWSRYCGGPCPTSPSSSRSIQGYRLGPPPRGIRRRPHYRFELVNVSPLEPWSICLVSMVRGVCFRENRSLGDDVGKDENIEEQRLWDTMEGRVTTVRKLQIVGDTDETSCGKFLGWDANPTSSLDQGWSPWLLTSKRIGNIWCPIYKYVYTHTDVTIHNYHTVGGPGVWINLTWEEGRASLT